jgi:hypothetical protein
MDDALSVERRSIDPIPRQRAARLLGLAVASGLYHVLMRPVVKRSG